MNEIQPSPLEEAVFTAFHELYMDQGFPAPTSVHIRRRINTGGGRYIDLFAKDNTLLADGYVDLAGHYIQMSGVPNGLMVVAHVKNHLLQQIEFAVYGNDAWDGVEREWAIV